MLRDGGQNNGVESLQKSQLRKELRRRLREAFPTEVSRISPALLAGLRGLLRLRNPVALAAYAAFREEPDLTPLLEEWLTSGKLLYLPRFRQADAVYEMVAIRNLATDCVRGKYGILEPSPELPVEEHLATDTLWFIPGVGFDYKGNRLGRGCGY